LETAKLVQISPLVKARADLDAACKMERRIAFSKLERDDIDLPTLLEEPICQPAQLAAEDLLDDALKFGSPDWTEWIQLKLALLTMRHRVVAPIIFEHKDAGDSHREKVHTEAYGVEGTLLEEVDALRSAYTSRKDCDSIAGSVAEVLTIALLNRATPAKAGARISNARADRYHKVDARYDLFGTDNQPMPVSLQVKTWGETVILPSKILQIGLYSILGSRVEGLETEGLIIRDTHDDLSQADQVDLTERSRALQSVIHSSRILEIVKNRADRIHANAAFDLR
jgi:hypothetical protein